MKTALFVLLVVALATVAAMAVWRRSDHRADAAERARLLATREGVQSTFDPAMVAGLPEPVRRYFLHAIRPGTPLATVAEIEMSGRFGLGDRNGPKYMTMEASQVLAAPSGFLWEMRARDGGMTLSGSDSGDWTRFWLMGLVPVARTGFSADHRRSAFGRLIAEAAFWTPAALLPGPGVVWEAPDPQTARVTVTHDGLSQSVELTIDAEGRATRVVLQRWSNANPRKVWQLQPFGGMLGDEREFDVYRVPTRVEAGNFVGTDAYFPFFVAKVESIRFLGKP
jgi:hypothetical protein